MHKKHQHVTITEIFVSNSGKTSSSGNCGKLMDGLCLKHKQISTKLVRATMEELEYFLEQNIYCVNKIRVIHLLRDPRGKSHSMNPKHQITKAFAMRMCQRQMKDIQKRTQLESRFPNTFLEVLYDSVAIDPLRESVKIYNFAFSKQLSKNATKWVEENTHKQNAKEKFYNTERRNSTATALAWKKKLKSDEVKAIQAACQELMEHLHLDFMN